MNKVFISFKNSNHGEQTADAEIAKNLCSALRAKNIVVFFSNFSLQEVGTDRYMDKIEEEICAADVMVVVGTQSDYVSKGWVRQEWMTFLNISLSNPEKSLYTYVPPPADVSKFPAFLRPHQSFKTQQEAITFITNKFLLQKNSATGTPTKSLFWSKYFGLFEENNISEALNLLPFLNFPSGLSEALQANYFLQKKDIAKSEENFLSSIHAGNVCGYYLYAHYLITGQLGGRQLNRAKDLLAEGRPFFRENVTSHAPVLFLIWTTQKRLSRVFYCAELFREIMSAYSVDADVMIYDSANPPQLDIYRDVVFLLNEDSFRTDEPFVDIIVKHQTGSMLMLNGFTMDVLPRVLRKYDIYACEDADIASISRTLIAKHTEKS